MFLHFLLVILSVLLGSILLVRSNTLSGTAIFTSLNRDFVNSSTSSLDSSFTVGTPSIRKQRRLPYCPNSSLRAWLLNVKGYKCFFNILFSESSCLHCFETSCCISLVISFLRSAIVLLNVLVRLTCYILPHDHIIF